MIIIRKANNRGLTENSWLKSYHTFSFGEYQDPAYKGFGALRVINQDTVKPGAGFGSHEHHDMEIISYVIAGGLEHKDSMGTQSIIKPGEIQIMSAGMGITHSEFNASKEKSVHFLQIWITPTISGLKPSYEQKTLPPSKKNELLLIGSPNQTDEAITIHQEVNLYVGYFEKAASIYYDFKPKRIGWIQLIKGKIELNDQLLSAGDGAQIRAENIMFINCIDDAEFLLFDLKE